MQTPVLSAILLSFPCVCMQAQESEVASVLQSVSCASDPYSAIARVLSEAFPYSSSTKKGYRKYLVFTFRQLYVRTDKILLFGYHEVCLILNV